MVLAGCITTNQAWVGLILALAYTGLALLIAIRPQLIWDRDPDHPWPMWAKRLAGLAMVGIGTFFIAVCLYTALTGRNPGQTC